MPSLTYLYQINQTVFNIDKDKGIRQGVVKKVEMSISFNLLEITYHIVYVDSSFGSEIVKESTLFPTPDDAWEHYKNQYLRQ